MVITIVSILAVYIIGCIFAFGKLTAAHYEVLEEIIEEESVTYVKAWYHEDDLRGPGSLAILGSWYTFFKISKEIKNDPDMEGKYFLKFNYKGLSVPVITNEKELELTKDDEELYDNTQGGDNIHSW